MAIDDLRNCQLRSSVPFSLILGYIRFSLLNIPPFVERLRLGGLGPFYHSRENYLLSAF